MKVREGDLIETFDHNFFDVKGLVHPPEKIVAFIRFVPDSKGDRKRNGIKYRKVYVLSKRYAYLRRNLPQYLVHDPVFDEELCEVPTKDLKHHYRPVDRLNELRRKKELDEVEQKALKLMKLLRETANVPWSKLGVSGSILVKLHTRASDIDPIVYSSENCRKVHAALRTLLKNKEGYIKAYDLMDLKELFAFRSRDTVTSFEDFVRTEPRKVLQGKFMDRDYFVRFVKDWEEVKERYGDVRYEAKGYAKIGARVVDDSEAIFTPCRYGVDDVEVLSGVRVPIREIVSFRGRFCEQARNGEKVIAQGKVERVKRLGEQEYYRLLLGNKPSDYMILA